MQHKPNPRPAATDQNTIWTLPEINYKELADAGNSYAIKGYSVVPVWGDLREGQQSKAPALDTWSIYQHEIATPMVIDDWFLNRGYGGIAIVLGSISKLVALDIDEQEIAERFALENPDLIDTPTTISALRGLPQYRYIPPAGASYKFAGTLGKAELRGEGQIIVAYPTVIRGKAYRVIRGGDPLQLNDEQWQRLKAFVAKYGKVEKGSKPAPKSTPSAATNDTLINYYQSQISIQGGRALALLAAACQGRDNGLTAADVSRVLIPAHIAASPVTIHIAESADERRGQAEAIIADTFKRPARQPSRKLSIAGVPDGLPTAAREQLLQLKLISIARVIDCLMLLKWTPGHAFTERLAVESCKPYAISRKIVRAALQHKMGFFPIIKAVGTSQDANAPVNGASAIASDSNSEGNQTIEVFVPVCHGWVAELPSVVRVSKGDKNSKGGRPATAATIYVMPDAATICKILDVENLGTDPLTLDDVGSVKLYRAAVNRGLITRRPGQYAKKLLGKRIGVTARTAHRYLKADKQIKKTERFKNVAVLTKVNYEGYLQEYAPVIKEGTNKGKTPPGVWLCVDGQYKTRYKPLAYNAEFLIKRHWLVELIKQDVNHYELVQPDQDANEGVG